MRPRLSGCGHRFLPGALACALLLAGLALDARPARASDSRRHGLAGNLAFDDDTDVHAFPQLAPLWGNRAGFDVTDQGQNFFGGAIFGDSTALGLFVRRPLSGDWFQPYHDDEVALARFAAMPGIAPPTGLQLEAPQPLLELVFGMRGGFGVGLKVANSMDQRLIQIEQPGVEGAAPEKVNAEEGAQSTAVVLNAGWSSRNSSRNLDLAGSLTFQRYKTVTEGKIRAEAALGPSFDLLARGAWFRSAGMSWVGVGQLYRRVYDLELPFHDNTLSEALFGVRLGAGPRLQLVDGVTLATLVWLGLDSHSYALDKSVEDATALLGRAGTMTKEARTRSYQLPGLDTALEVQATDWLTLRGGYSMRYLFHSSEALPVERVDDPLGDGDTAREQRTTELVSGWAAGATVQVGGLRVDGSFAPALLNAGPNLIGGQSTGTFAWLGLAYAWGAGQGTVLRAQEPRPEEPGEEGIYPEPTRTRRTPATPYPADGSPYFPPAGDYDR